MPAKTPRPKRRATPAAEPSSLNDVLLPLVAAATQTSIAAYAWGLKHGSLYKAGLVMDLCGDLLRELNTMTAQSNGRAPVLVTPPQPLNPNDSSP